MKKLFIITSIVILILLTWTVWSKSLVSKNPDTLATNGLHWHSTLEIYMKGEKVEIPANIGLMGGHNPIHTHDEDSTQGVIHMEFGGLVKKSDTRLGQFFNIWNKDIGSFGQNMKMTVNGIENVEFANYEMRDGDKIELRYG